MKVIIIPYYRTSIHSILSVGECKARIASRIQNPKFFTLALERDPDPGKLKYSGWIHGNNFCITHLYRLRDSNLPTIRGIIRASDGKTIISLSVTLNSRALAWVALSAVSLLVAFTRTGPAACNYIAGVIAVAYCYLLMVFSLEANIAVDDLKDILSKPKCHR
jgi:hypothetical protein